MSGNLDTFVEQGLLSGLLSDPTLVDEIANILKENDFSEPRHARIYETVTSMRSDGKSISLASVAATLRDAGSLHEVGGVDYLTELTDPSAPYALYADPVQYAGVIFEESSRRNVFQYAQSLIARARPDSGVGVTDILADAQKELGNILDRSIREESSSSAEDMYDLMLEEFEARGENPDGIVGVPTGFVDLDAKCSGFKPGQFIILAARPSIGKSTLAVDFMRNAAIRAKKTCYLFTLEMERPEVMEKIMAAEAGVLLNNLKTGNLDSNDWNSLSLAQEKLRTPHLIIDDTPGMTIDYIRLKCQQQLAKPAGLDFVVIDYLQLMRSSGRVESRQQEVSEWSRALKVLAQELRVPVLALSQLNRGSENRTDKTPMISDLRESGSLEQDADIVLLLHRPPAEEETAETRTSLIIAKHRGGEQGVVPLAPLLEYGKFANAAGFYPAPDNAYDPPPSEDDGYAPPYESPGRSFGGGNISGGVNQDTGEVMSPPPPPPADPGSSLPAW